MTPRSKFFIVLFGLVCAMASAFADDSPADTRAQHLFYQIRCVVCQGETIADSHAEIASDMRRDIRARIASGQSDTEIKNYLVAHYGDTILMQPPLKAKTWPLWFGPLALLAAGAFFARRFFRKSRLGA